MALHMTLFYFNVYRFSRLLKDIKIKVELLLRNVPLIIIKFLSFQQRSTF